MLHLLILSPSQVKREYIMLDIQAFFDEIVDLAEVMFSREFPGLKLVIDRKPKGKHTLAYYRPFTRSVHINDVTIGLLDEQTLKHIIIHEIAHHVMPIIFPNHKQDHGPEFKRVDRALGGLGQTRIDIKDASHAFLAASSVRKTKKFTYSCICTPNHQLTTVRHNKIVRGLATYSCAKCNTRLKQVK